MKYFTAIFFLLIQICMYAQTIHSVSFEEKGGYKFGSDALRLYIQSRKGAQYDGQVVNDDIKRLHGTGFFSDVSSETIKRPDGQIDLIFKLVPQNTVTKVTFKGNQQYERSKLLEKVNVVVGAPLNYKHVHESAAALRKLYADAGHQDTTVMPRIRRSKDGKVEVEFVIRENLKLKISKVFFKGAKVYDVSDLRSSITNQASWFSWVPLLELGLLNKKELQNDVVRLREKYWELGYLDFRVKDIQINTLKKDPQYVEVVFVIEEGKPYKIGNVSIDGNQRFESKELTPFLQMKKGDVYSLSKERRSIKGIEGKYSPLGYVDFQGNAEKIPDYRTHTVDVVYHVTEGEPFKIREIFISGNKWTKDHVIRRELAIEPGEPVDKNRIEASKSRLMGMGYFKKVDTLTMNAREPGTKDVDIIVDEKNFVNARIGGGFSDSDGIAGLVELSHTNMDILDPWNYFTGGGQRARILALIGTRDMNLEANFTEPWLFGKKLRWEVSGYFRNVSYSDEWDERRIGVTTSLTKRIFDDFTSVSGGYTFEHVKIHNMDSDLSWRFQEQEGGSYVGRFHLSLDRDTRDNALIPTSGYNINLLGSMSSKIFGGSENYYRLEAKAVNHYSFFRKWFTLTTGAKVGYIGTFAGTDNVPLYERYFLGGGDSIRGFPYRSIGPSDRNNDNYGGDFMYSGTIELSHPIYKFVRGAVFADIGGSGDSETAPKPNIGVGYGLRIVLPTVNAPIRLDLAFPVLNNQPSVKNSLRFHFNMGFSLF